MMKKSVFVLCALLICLFAAGCTGNKYSPDTESSAPSQITHKFILLPATSLDIHMGESVPLNASISPASTEQIGYTSSNNKVAIADAKGIIYALSQGTAVITASTPDGKTTAKCQVSVAGFKKMNLSGSVPATAKGGDNFTVKVTFENCSYPSVKVVTDCGGGSISAGDKKITFGSDVMQNQVAGSAVVTFTVSASKAVNTIRIIGLDNGEMVDMKEYTLAQPSTSVAK